MFEKYRLHPLTRAKLYHSIKIMHRCKNIQKPLTKSYYKFNRAIAITTINTMYEDWTISGEEYREIRKIIIYIDQKKMYGKTKEQAKEEARKSINQIWY